MTALARILIAVALSLILGIGGGALAQQKPQQSGAAFQVGPDHDIYGPDGKRFIVRGVIGFNRAFATFRQYWHEDWSYRAPTIPADRISPPTGFLQEIYVNHDFALNELRAMRSYGANLVRIFVEPAMFHTASYTDKRTGLTLPPEPQILDDVIASAASLGMVVQLQPGEDNVPDAMLAEFVGRLAARYRDQWNVWLNTANEPFSTGIWNPDGSETFPNPRNRDRQAWAARIGGALSAIRAAGFRNPVVVGPLNLWKIDSVIAELRKEPFASDPNLIMGPHLFYVNRKIVRFAVGLRRQFEPGIAAFKDKYAIVIDAFGFTNSPKPMARRVRDFVFRRWVPNAFKWLSDVSYDGITLFVWPPAYNHVMYLVRNQPGRYPLTDWGRLAREGYALVGRKR